MKALPLPHRSLPAVLLATALALLGASATAQDLDYAQQRSLKDAIYYVNRAQKEIPPIAAQAKKWKADPTAAVAHQLQAWQNKVGYAGRRLNNARSRLKALPAGNPQVAAVNAQVHKLAETLRTADETLRAVKSGNAKTSDMSAWPTFAADRAKIADMARTISVPQLLESHPRRGLHIAASLSKMVEFYRGAKAKYQPLVNLQTTEGRQMATELRSFEVRLEAFKTAANRYVQNAPTSIANCLQQARDYAHRAVQKRKPILFTNAVANAFRQATDRIAVFGALAGNDDAKVRAASRDAAKLKGELAVIEKKLEADIINTNVPPKDLYAGGDKQAILRMVETNWKKHYANDRIVGIRIPQQAWERNTSWRWASVAREFQKHDYSELQAAVLVKTTGDLVTRFTVYLTKKHLEGDRIKVVVDNKKNVSVHQKIRVANLKT